MAEKLQLFYQNQSYFTDGKFCSLSYIKTPNVELYMILIEKFYRLVYNKN